MKNKSLLILLLAVVLVILGAMLPQIVGNMVDNSDLNQIEFANVSDVQLEFVESGISMREVMGIICRNTHSVEIPADMAGHTASEIQLLASQAITHYQDAGLILHEVDVYSQMLGCQPYLLYEQSSSRKSNIFWTLSLAPSDGSWEMELVIDDKTGRVCSINYDYNVDPDYIDRDYVNTAEPIYEDLEATLLTFSELFLSGLGDEFSEFDAGQIEEGTSISIDENFISSSISWQDTIQGDCHIVFYVLDTRFYTLTY